MAAISWVIAAAGAGTNTVRVKLTPAVAGTPTVAKETEKQEHGHPK
jgi:hypothetical protein